MYQVMKEHGKPFSETKIRNWCFQIFQALDYMHKSGYFHRDLKPGDYQEIIVCICFYVAKSETIVLVF